MFLIGPHRGIWLQFLITPLAGVLPIQTAGQPAFTGGVPTLPAIAAWAGQQVKAKAEILWYAIMCM